LNGVIFVQFHQNQKGTFHQIPVLQFVQQLAQKVVHVERSYICTIYEYGRACNCHANNGETVYLALPKVHFIRLSCSLYNSWHNLEKEGSAEFGDIKNPAGVSVSKMI